MTQSLIVDATAYEAGLVDRLDNTANDEASRAQAFAVFARTGLPHRRMEAWKWTDLRAALQPVDDIQVSVDHPSRFRDTGVFTITLDEEGAHWGDAVPAGVTLRVTDEVADLLPLLGDHPVARLTQALSAETLIINVADGADIAAPIHLYRAGASAQHFTRVLITVGEGANLTVIDSFEAADHVGFDNLLVEARVDAAGQLTRLFLAKGGAKSVDTALWGVEVQSRAQFHQRGLAFGAKRSRTETQILFAAPEAEVTAFSASLVAATNHADVTTHITHGAEACVTDQVHKSVVAGRGQSVFQGKFLVDKAGQKTDANMQANALLLSEGATVNHKPELEIYADDVVCAHGSTSGALDDDALFYLRQRGLSKHQARALLVEAFVGEIIDEVAHDGTAEIFRQLMNEFLKEV